MTKDRTKYLVGEVIQHLANLGFNLTSRQLRHWDNLGLFGSVKNESGYREFSYEDIEKIILVVGLKTLGISLSKIKTILLYATTKEQLLELLKKHPDSLMSKYADPQDSNKEQWYLNKETRDMFKDIEVSLKRTKDGLKRFEELFVQVNVNISQAVLEYQKAHKR